MINNLAALSNLKVLYVEDDPETRKELEIFLKRRVGKVFTASDGAEGLEKYKLSNPDIVIVDLIMPRLGGLEMIQRLRAEGSSCHVIVTSTINEVDTVLSAVDMGISKYIVKPIHLAELVEALEKIALSLNNNLLNESLTIHPVLRKKYEDTLKKEFAIFFKATAGKGPRDIVVFICGNELQVSIYDGYTQFEQSLLATPTNLGLIEQVRRSFYETTRDSLISLIFQVTELQTSLDSIRINPLSKLDSFVFQFLKK